MQALDIGGEYREQIRRCAASLAIGQVERVGELLMAGQAAARLKMFTDGNLDKRFEKLGDHLELLADDFENWEELRVEYVKTVPLAAYDSMTTDAERFLNWLADRVELTPEQQDLVTCQRSRHTVEDLAAENRLAHVRFQELWQSVESFAPELGSNDNLWIHLNPIHTWATLQTSRLLDEDDDLPASIVFFPVGNDTRTAVLEDAGRQLVAQLASGPRRLDEINLLALELSRDEAIDLCLDLADIGLAAFG